MAKHVYENSVTEWFVAESTAHAAELCKTMNAKHGHPAPDAELDLDFTQTPDDKVLTMEDDDSRKVTKTAAAFAAENDPGFLGTTEY